MYDDDCCVGCVWGVRNPSELRATDHEGMCMYMNIYWYVRGIGLRGRKAACLQCQPGFNPSEDARISHPLATVAAKDIPRHNVEDGIYLPAQGNHGTRRM